MTSVCLTEVLSSFHGSGALTLAAYPFRLLVKQRNLTITAKQLTQVTRHMK